MFRCRCEERKLVKGWVGGAHSLYWAQPTLDTPRANGIFNHLSWNWRYRLIYSTVRGVVWLYQIRIHRETTQILADWRTMAYIKYIFVTLNTIYQAIILRALVLEYLELIKLRLLPTSLCLRCVP